MGRLHTQLAVAQCASVAKANKSQPGQGLITTTFEQVLYNGSRGDCMNWYQIADRYHIADTRRSCGAKFIGNVA